MTGEKLAKIVRDRGVTTVRVGGSDADGVWKGKRVAADLFLKNAEAGFSQSDSIFATDIAGKLYEGLDTAGWQAGFPNLLLKPDLATFAAVPWEAGGAWVVADFQTADGKALDLSPRELLRRVVAEARKAGFLAQAAFEMAFRIYRREESAGSTRMGPLSSPRPGHALASAHADESILEKIRRSLDAAGIAVETWHRGHAPGDSEISLKVSDALSAADRALLFKCGVKEICIADSLAASFMARPDRGYGLAGHMNLSLWDAKGAKNMFAAEAKAAKAGGTPVSETARHFIGGTLAALPELLIMLAPNVNSFKRFAPSGFAPISVTWGVENRSCALRVSAPANASAARIEHRVPGADLNPYLALAAFLASGLHGVREKIDPPPSIMGSAYETSERAAPRLPRSLGDAVDLFEKSELAKRTFGEAFVKYYARTRRSEWDLYLREVSAWERDRYLETV